jgi:hypothetical protein
MSQPIQLPKFKGEFKVHKARIPVQSAFLRRLPLSISVVLFLFAIAACRPLAAQDDKTTQYGASGYNGAFITGPASNPLSFLNGAAFRTTANPAPYDVHDFAPMTDLDATLPDWIHLSAEERFRYEAYDNNNLKAKVDDSYILNRFRFQMDVHAGSWFRVTAQVQDARSGFQNPPIGPPNTVRWDLKLAYAELGDPEKHWFSLRVGRQLINYNNTIIANSEWRNQARSYDAAVLNLNAKRAHVGIFAASPVVPQAYGVSPHQEGNNIYGAYGRIDDLVPHSNLEPFFLWRVQPAEVIEPAVGKTTGKEDEKAVGLRFKGQSHASLDYSIEAIIEGGKVGPQAIHAFAGQGGLAYQFLGAVTKPRVFGQYDYASGNTDPAQSGHHTTFDTIEPTAHDRFGITDLFGWQNIETVRAGTTIEPHRRVTLTAQGLDFWAASALDSIYNTSGSSIVYNKTAPKGRHVGAEIDGYSWYELNKHFNLGGGVGYFGGGQFLTNVTTSHSYTTYYIALNFKDNGKK